MPATKPKDEEAVPEFREPLQKSDFEIVDEGDGNYLLAYHRPGLTLKTMRVPSRLFIHGLERHLESKKATP